MQDSMPLGLSDLGPILRRRWWLLVFIPLVAALVAGGLGYRTANQISYQASTTLLMGEGAGSMPTYRELVRSQLILEAARQKLPGLDLGQLRSMISVQIQPDTQLLQVVATAQTPALAEQVAAEVAHALVETGKRLVIMPEPTVAGLTHPMLAQIAVEVDHTPASRVATATLKRAVISAFLVGCVAAAALVVALESLALLGRAGKRG